MANTSEVKVQLSKRLEEVLSGEEVIIAKADKPIATLVPYEKDSSSRDLSQSPWQGKVWLADDLDELPQEIQAAFGMK